MTADDILAAALQYVQRGWVVHRLHSPHSKKSSAPGKAPVDARWPKKSEPPSEHQIRKWFTSKNDYNVGLLCGRVSGVTVIDIDDFLFMDGVDVGKLDTLMSARTKGRGHIFFKYNPNLKSSKHHDLGIEVLNDGNNAVLPPSIHTSGDVYRWRDPDADLAEMPGWFEDWLRSLFEADKRLKLVLGKCRPCFKIMFNDRRTLNFHGATGREGMLALCTELVAAGAGRDDIRILAKMIYRHEYDQTKTDTELSHIDKNRTWKCDTIRSKLGAEFNTDCEKCKSKSAGHDAIIAGSTPVECGTTTACDTRLQILDGRLIWTEGGISLVCGYESDTPQWSYQFFADGAALTRSCTSAKSPCEEEPYRRDPLLRKLLKGCEWIDVDAAMRSITEFGLHLVRNPEIFTEYMGALKPHKKKVSAAVELTEDEIEEAMDLLKNPKLVEIVEVAIHGARLRGEHLNTIITFITMLSTLVAKPLVLHWTGNSAIGKTALVKAVIRLFPDEMLFVRSGVTPKVLYYDADEDETGELVNDLTEYIIVLLEEDESKNFVNEIKPLLSHDLEQITYSFVDKKKNGNKTQHVIVRGFPAFIGLTTQSYFDDQISTRSLIGTPDDSKEKVASIIDDRAHAEVMPWVHDRNDEPTVIQNAIRLLKPVNMIIPFMGVVREHFPHEDPRASRDFGQFISMIQTCTTLHQFQRHSIEVDGVEYVVAHLFDLDLALRMIESLLCETISGIPKDVKKFLEGMIADGGSDYTKTKLMKLYSTIMGRSISRNHLTDRYLTLLINLGVLDVVKVGNAHTYSVCEKQLSLSVMSSEILRDIVRDETKERLLSDYLLLTDTSLGDIHIPPSKEEIRGMCMSSYVGYQSDRFNGLFNRCLTDEYPRRYSTKYMTDNDRRDEEEKLPEDADETDAAAGAQVMQLIREYVEKYGKQDDHTFNVIAAKIEDEAFGADLIRDCIEKYREGHRIFIPRKESE